MSTKAPLYNMAGQRVGEVDLPDDVFGILPNRSVMHQALVRQLANARQGTHATQVRSQVSRTGKKWYKQKGTGNARHGDKTANLFKGGAVAHGPQPRSYEKEMPRQMRRLALRSALSAKAAESEIVLIDQLAMDEPRTRDLRDLVDNVCGGASTLVVLAESNDTVERSARNLSHVRYLRAGYLNVRDLLGYDRLLLPMDALDAIIAHLGQEGVVVVAAPEEGMDDTPPKQPTAKAKPAAKKAGGEESAAVIDKPAAKVAAKPADKPADEGAKKPAAKSTSAAKKAAGAEPAGKPATQTDVKKPGVKKSAAEKPAAKKSVTEKPEAKKPEAKAKPAPKKAAGGKEGDDA